METLKREILKLLDKDVIVCLNLLKRNPRCGEFPLPLKAIHEVLKMEVKRIVNIL